MTSVLYDDGRHRNLLLEECGRGAAVQANLHLVVEPEGALLLDPGGHQVYPRAVAEVSACLGDVPLRYVFLSHQDPDAVAALNGWLMVSEAEALISSLYVRFIPHFGLDELVEHRLRPLPDEGARLRLGRGELLVLPAHFLHSEANFQIYDPAARILYSGDLGASFGAGAGPVADFDAHLPFLEPFHRRHMASRRALAAWAEMVRALDIEIIAPQHGAAFVGRDVVARLIEWCAGLECGIDLLPAAYRVPAGGAA
jgi:flavorubredoxin